MTFRALSGLRDSRWMTELTDAVAMAYWRTIDRQPGDVFLCSYPKSGRTWLRFMLTHYQLQLLDSDRAAKLTLKNFPELSPNLTLFSGYRLQPPPSDLPIKRLIGTHSESPSRFAGHKVLFIQRDLRDVLVSYYHHRLARREIVANLDAFLRSRWGIEHAVRYANRWSAALARWPSDQLLHLTYERLHADTAGCLADSAHFLELDVRPDLLELSVEAAAAGRMRRLEARFGTPDFSTKALADDANAFQVRRARVGGYQHELSTEQAVYVGERLRAELDTPGGYDY